MNGSFNNNNNNSTASPRSKNISKKFNQNKSSTTSKSPAPSTLTGNTNNLQIFTNEDVESTGTLFPSPESLGFTNRKPSNNPRPVPKYFLTQPKLLHTPPFVQNQWDQDNQAKMAQMELANQGRDYQGLYEDFQKLREVERSRMEELGLVDAENSAKDLTEAITFQGSCLDMCPVFERVRRQLENNVKALEKDPTTNKISRERAVKAFSRPAAGQPPPLPSDVRPPHVLKQTLDYLVDTVLDQLPDAHSFIWDRTRSIRQDFTYQNNFGPEAIDCHERIVRIHLLSLHIMAGSDVEYSQQQELEQFNKALQTLMEIYQDVRTNGGKSPNEVEFRAYHLLSHVRDPDLERQIQNLPNDIFQDSKVQLALNFRNIMTQNNVVERGVTNLVGALNLYTEFFRLVYSDETPLLMACLLETHFNEVRFYALKAMSRSFHTKTKPYSLTTLQHVLGFDSMDKLIKFLKYYEIDIVNNNGEALVDLFNKEKLEKQYKLNSYHEKAKFSPPYSSQLDRKYNQQSLKSFVNSGLPNNLIKFETKIINIKPKESKPFTPASSSFNPPQQPVQVNDFPSFQPAKQENIKPTPVKFSPSIQTNENKFATKPETPFQFTPKESTNNQALNPSLIKNEPTKLDFSFSNPPALSKKPSNEPAPKVSFNFNSQPQPQSQQPAIKSIPKIDQKMTPTPTPTPPSSLLESTSSISVAKPVAIPKKTKKLNELSKYPQALQQVFHDILQDTMDSELKLILSRILEDFYTENERKGVITSLSGELYDAFLTEVIHEVVYEAKAYQFYVTNLKRKSIKLIIKNSKKAYSKICAKKSKLQELKSVSLEKSSKKKRRYSTSSVDSNSSITKRKRSESVDISAINEKQQEVHELWEPLDLDKFVRDCSNNLSLKIDHDNLDLSFLVIVENWNSLYSKWLNSKLNMKANMALQVYENLVQNDKINLNFTSLPSKDYLNKDFFSKTGFILFECGLTLPGDITIEDKLKRDAKSLKKIVSLVDKYSYRKVSIVVTFWDVSESGISSEEVSKLLNLSEYSSVSNLSNLVLCDMTVKHGNINRILTQAFNKISQEFNGQLTMRGIKHETKLEMLRKRTQIQPVTTTKINTEISKIQSLESKIMKKAKNLQRYDYLNNHVNNSSRTFQVPANTSINTSMNKTSLVHYLAHKNLNKSINYNNSTFLNSSIMTDNNESILGGFGKGVMEESTPITSPKRKKASGSNNLSQLRELTAGIKKKYKK
ncbi:SAC3 Nuclear mRNA export protein SAC3 [Candida maltosa Xu316]